MGYNFSTEEQQRYDVEQVKGEMEEMYDRVKALEKQCSGFINDIAMILEIIDCFDLTDEQKEIVKKFYPKSNTPQ